MGDSEQVSDFVHEDRPYIDALPKQAADDRDFAGFQVRACERAAPPAAIVVPFEHRRLDRTLERVLPGGYRGIQGLLVGAMRDDGLPRGLIDVRRVPDYAVPSHGHG